ncbi:PREDICTED: F-box protein At3g08750-like [Ipomoea nil]|uniref:F-box protein At3g08750-like n=1 Tax=Ipomoea nil TaxID=35883 RepID=UPI000901F0EB|nr:PREDICTED: F-box protein At3g08750-like [Ipomoea nil]
MENCIILRDVVIEILARLPVKSLIRFKCVCKFFYSLIKSDNHFKHKHFEISRAKRDYVVFQHNKPTFYEDRGFGLVYKESDSDEIGCVDLTFPTSGIDDVRYADGMFCLFNYVSLVNYVWDISIWNPSTREIKKLQNIKALDGYHREYTTMIGFGLSSNMIGKVVLIWITPDPIVMVCSLDDNNSCGWKRFSPSLDISDVDDHRSNLYLKGKYYWSCKIKDQNQIVWFDFDDETFGKIEFPEIHSSSWPAISAMKDTIALISCNIDMNQDRGFGLVYKESDSGEIGCVDLTFPTSGIGDVREIKKLQNTKALDGYHREYTTMIGFGLSSKFQHDGKDCLDLDYSRSNCNGL